MKKILWVEDEIKQFKTFSHDIKNFEIVRKDNYTSALQEIKDNQYDLYIIDVILPSGKKVNSREEIALTLDTYYGVELIKNIRKQDKITPIIVVSELGHASEISKSVKTTDPNIEMFLKYDIDSEVIKNKIDEIFGEI